MKRIFALVALAALLMAFSAPALNAREGAGDLRVKMLTLENTLVSIDFSEKPLAEILNYFAGITGVNLALHPLVLEERNESELAVNLRLSKVSVKTALGIILELKELSAVYRHGVIFVTTPKDARGKPVLRIYAIGDLTVRIRDFPGPDIRLHPSGSEGLENMFGREEEGKEHAFADPDFIMDLITQNSGEGTWEDDGVRFTVNERYLFIRQYPTVHREIAGILNLLRAFR